MDLLESCKAVALKVPPGSAKRLERVELALNVDRALNILKKQMAKAPVNSEVVLWVESSSQGRKAHPNFLSRPHGMTEPEQSFEIDSDFTVCLSLLLILSIVIYDHNLISDSAVYTALINRS